MKKFLLSALCFAGVASVAFAENVTLNVDNATNIDGTHSEEVLTVKDYDGNITQQGSAEHYQPLNSLEINGYKFTFEQGDSNTAPAYYFATSNNKDQQKTIRVYGGKSDAKGNTMTITAPEGVTFGQINFSCKSGTKDAKVEASVGAVSGVTATAMVWKNDTPVNTVTLTFTNKTRIAEMVIMSESESGEENPTPDPEPEPVSGSTFTKVTSLENGKYVFVVNNNVAKPVTTAEAYGYMYFDETASFQGDNVITSEDYALTITITDEGTITLLDPANRYYGMNNNYASIQCGETLSKGYYWTYEFDGDNIKVANAMRPDYVLGKGTKYNSFSPQNTAYDYTLPTIYKLVASSAVEAIEAEVNANAPVVYYNLQGQRVANPENGLYIRVQGNKVAKVIL